MRKKTANRKTVFVSSVQKELNAERRAIKNFLQNDPLLRRFFDVFLFEDLPASDRRADDVYLDEVENCDLYVGLFGNEYGSEDAKGISPTEREFDLASQEGKPRLIFVNGTNVHKPIPSYQIYKGTAFELVDQAVDFVLSKIDRHIGTRAESVQAPATYELPKEAVTEAIVNAVAHRDYTSNASVQVMLFADRLEVWNPGELPPSLTPERLREPHASIPRNPLVAEPLYLARYIEKAGNGTLDMIDRCGEAGLPSPDFEERAGQFVTTIWRDWVTAEAISGFGLNERQLKAVAYVKVHAQISNKDYREVTGAIIRTASRDLEELVSKGILRKIGATGRSAHYVLARKQDMALSAEELVANMKIMGRQP